VGNRIIIDGHVHCGPRTIQGVGALGQRERLSELSNPIERLKKDLEEIDVKGAVIMPFPEDIYRKPFATPESVQKAHEYLLEIAINNDSFYPFYFVWNDYIIPDNLAEYKGIKWHRHFWSEPEYDYTDPRCDEFVEVILEYDLPVIFEDSFENTKLFCNKYPDLKIIIPHIGLVNGGSYKIIPEFKNYPNVYVETSLAYPFEIITAITQFGVDRVIFGSDAPYSSTKIELYNLLEYDSMKYFSDEDTEKILGKNMLGLMNVRASL